MVLVCFECFESLHMGLQGFTLQTTEGGANNIHTSKKNKKYVLNVLKLVKIRRDEHQPS